MQSKSWAFATKKVLMLLDIERLGSIVVLVVLGFVIAGNPPPNDILWGIIFIFVARGLYVYFKLQKALSLSHRDYLRATVWLIPLIGLLLLVVYFIRRLIATGQDAGVALIFIFFAAIGWLSRESIGRSVLFWLIKKPFLTFQQGREYAGVEHYADAPEDERVDLQRDLQLVTSRIHKLEEDHKKATAQGMTWKASRIGTDLAHWREKQKRIGFELIEIEPGKGQGKGQGKDKRFIRWPLEGLRGVAKLIVEEDLITAVELELLAGRYTVRLFEGGEQKGKSKVIEMDGRPCRLRVSSQSVDRRSTNMSIQGENGVEEEIPLW